MKNSKLHWIQTEQHDNLIDPLTDFILKLHDNIVDFKSATITFDNEDTKEIVRAVVEKDATNCRSVTFYDAAIENPLHGIFGKMK